MPWNYMWADSTDWTSPVRRRIGPGGFTRAGARAEIQKLLDANPDLAQLAAEWRADPTRQVAGGPRRVWTVYEHPDGDPHNARMIQVVEVVERLRQLEPLMSPRRRDRSKPAKSRRRRGPRGAH